MAQRNTFRSRVVGTFFTTLHKRDKQCFPTASGTLREPGLVISVKHSFSNYVIFSNHSTWPQS